MDCHYCKKTTVPNLPCIMLFSAILQYLYRFKVFLKYQRLCGIIVIMRQIPGTYIP